MRPMGPIGPIHDANSLAISGLQGCTSLTNIYVSHNPLYSLDVSGMTCLVELESYGNTALTYVNITGCSNLWRVCLESNAISGQIDTTGCDSLRDFRAALTCRSIGSNNSLSAWELIFPRAPWATGSRKEPTGCSRWCGR
jgi:hypothetical protein